MRLARPLPLLFGKPILAVPLRASPRAIRTGSPSSAALFEGLGVVNQRHEGEPGFFTPRGPKGSDERGGQGRDGGPSPDRPDPQPLDPRRRVSDREYMLRVGRAYDLLRGTMPEFMRTGLVDYDSASSSSSSGGVSLLEAFTFRRLLSSDRSEKSEGRQRNGGKEGEEEDLHLERFNRAYHPNIHFQFCVPVPSPHSSLSMPSSAPSLSEDQGSEDASLSFSGRSLYFASAGVLRHTLNVLFSEPRVDVERIRLERRDGSLCSQGGANMTGARDHVLHLRASFSGNLRMTRAPHKYTLIFKYEFDDNTGLISRHTVMRIEPEIGRKLWMGLSSVWQRLAGFAPQAPEPQTAHAHCHGRIRYGATHASMRGAPLMVPHRIQNHASSSSPHNRA